VASARRTVSGWRSSWAAMVPTRQCSAKNKNVELYIPLLVVSCP
jgi:hypothetical protein